MDEDSRRQQYLARHRRWQAERSQNLLRPAVLLRKLRSARFRLRAALGRGALPNALIIGAMKSGTSSLHDHLVQHQDVAGSRTKELHFFDNQFACGERWYRANFVDRDAPVRLESTPYYLFHPLAPQRAAAMVPDARLIALLREPAERAYSHYNQNVEEGLEPLSFAEAIAREGERLAGTEEALLSGAAAQSFAHQTWSYAGKSLYVPQLQRWLRHFRREQLLVLRAEDLFRAPQDVVDQASDFLGIPRRSFPELRPANQRLYPPMDPAVRARLDAVFQHDKAALAEQFGIAWP